MTDRIYRLLQRASHGVALAFELGLLAAVAVLAFVVLEVLVLLF